MHQYLRSEDDGLKSRQSGPWAVEKLDYLERYINVFSTSMHEKFVRNYIDLLSGPGKNRIRGKNEIKLGSPLLAMMTSHPFQNYYFVDMDIENTNALMQRCAIWDFANRVHTFTGDCNIIVDQIVSDLKPNESRSINLAFLDPEGMELTWRTISKLATIKRMDLIINYPQMGLNRLMSVSISSTGENAVDRFFGDQEWRSIYQAWLNKQTPSLHRQLIDHIKDKLKDLDYKDIVSDDETGDEPLMRNAKKNAPLYRLLFASKHERGHDFWQKIIRRDVHGQSRFI